MAQWLLWQATVDYLLLIPLGAVCIWSVLVATRNRTALLTLILPICWLLPIALAGAFTDWNSTWVKTADWVGGAAELGAVAQIAVSVAVIRLMKGQRFLAVVAVLVNVGVGLMAFFVVAMASSGDWL